MAPNLESIRNSKTMIPVASKARAAPMRCSRLLCRMNAKRSRMAARGLEGRGNQDSGTKIGLAAGNRQPGTTTARLAVELEAQGNHHRRADRAAILARRTVAPLRDQMLTRGGEKDRIGAPDG